MPSVGFGWAFNVGGTNQDAGTDITTDTSGNLYVTGWFSSSTVNFDPNNTNPSNPNNTLTSPGTNSSQFAAKYTTNQRFQWVRGLGTSTGPAGIAVDGAGNVYVADVDPSNNNATDISKLDAGGTVRWKVALSGSSASAPGNLPTSVAIGPSGNVYVTGRNASAQAFAAKLDPSGNVFWDRPIGGSSTEGLAVAVDSAEHIYVAYASVTTAYNFQVASLNAVSGSTLWSGSLGSSGNLSAGIAVDGAGNVYVAGGGSPFFVAKLAPGNNGSLTQAWIEQFSGTDYATGVAVDGAGNVYVTGSFEGSVDFDPGPGTYILQSAYYAQTIHRVVYHFSTYDIFLSELNTNGNFVAAADIVSGASPNAINNNAHAVALDSAGSIYSTGGFRGTANFNPVGTYDLTVDGGSNSSNQDIFVSKLPQSSFAGGASGPSLSNTGTNSAIFLASSSISLPPHVESSNLQQAARDRRAWQAQTNILQVAQETLGTSLKGAVPTTSVNPALPYTKSPLAVDRLFAHLMSCPLVATLAADALLAPLA